MLDTYCNALNAHSFAYEAEIDLHFCWAHTEAVG